VKVCKCLRVRYFNKNVFIFHVFHTKAAKIDQLSGSLDFLRVDNHHQKKSGTPPQLITDLLSNLKTNLLPPIGSSILLQGHDSSILVERHPNLRALVETRDSLKEFEEKMAKWTICRMEDGTCCLFEVTRGEFHVGDFSSGGSDCSSVDEEKIHKLISTLNEKLKINTKS